MAKPNTIIPGSNLTGLPQITETDLKENSPERFNRIFRLLATQIQSVQSGKPSSTGVTNYSTTIIQSSASSGGGGGGGGVVSNEVITLQGTHIQRIAVYPPSNYPPGCLFYETDRVVTYLNYTVVAGVQVWQWLTGTMIAIFANRPTDLGTYDAGFLFYASDLNLTYRWTGTMWSEYNNIEPVLQDTHANRLSTYPSTQYDINTLFYEQDRSLFYIVQNATGICSTSGTAVSWVSGNHFINTGLGFNAAQWPAGTIIIINSIPYTIGIVLNDGQLTIETNAGIQTSVPYVVMSGRWVYATGDYIAAYSSLPNDLGENDINVEFTDNVTYFRSWTWTGSGWTYSVGQPPYLAVQLTMNNSADPGWVAATGGSASVSKSDATTSTITLPSSNGYFLQGGVYSGTQIPAADTTLNSYTPSGAVGATFAGDFAPSSFAAGAGSFDVVSFPYQPSGTISAAFNGNPATITVATEGAPPTMMFPLYVKL